MRRDDEIETCYGGVLIPIRLERREVETERASQEENLMQTLSDDQKKIAQTFGMPLDKFTRAAARLSRRAETYGLTADQLKVARNAGMSPRAFASAVARNSGKTAIAAASAPGEGQPGLAGAHREVDFAHKAGDEAGNASDRELRDAALAALTAYDPDKDDDDNYDRLLDGVLYGMRLLNRVAPEFAESETEDRRGGKGK